MNISQGAAKWIFILGTVSSIIIFLVLTVDTHRQIGALTNAEALSEDVIAGKRVWQKNNCNDCHTILGFGGYYAPDLTKAYRRLGEENLRRVISEPDKYFEKSFRKMPKQNISPEEVSSLVAFLKWTSEIDNNDWPPQDRDRATGAAARLTVSSTVSPGAALFKEHGCLQCHRINGVGGTAGPELDKVGTKYDAAAIKDRILNPQSYNTDSVMPPATEIDEEDVDKIVEFLSTLK
ncbi:MAG: cytochrome c [bacterium]